MDVIQLSSGKLDFSSTQVDLEGVLLEWNRTGATIRSIEVYRGSGLMFGFVRQSPKPLKSFGHEFDSGHAVVWQPDNPLEYIAPLGLTSLVIHVDSTLVDLLGWIVRGTAWQRVPQSHLAKLEETCRLATSAVAKMCSAATTAERDEFIGPWRDRILASLETALEPWLAVQSPVDATDPGTRHFRLFKDAEQIFQQYDPGSTPGIDAVAATIGVPRRTLFHAFRTYLGMGPHAYLQLVRLHRLRQELRTATPEQTTVTALAYAQGFSNVGRLAAFYKAQFGEYPHETLRRH